jgi:hypothetical protein
MNETAVHSLNSPLRERNSFRLILLFIFTFLVLFILFVFYNLFVSLAEEKAAEAAVPDRPAVVQIDPKIESELAKVMSFDTTGPAADTVRDPFIDYGNISGSYNNPTNIAVPGTVGPGGTVAGTGTAPATAGRSGEGGTGVRSPSSVRNPAATKDTTDNSVSEPQIDTKIRFERWRQETRFWSQAEPDARIFAVEDLIPVGMVSGGNMGEEVIFYSQAAQRTMSFPVGTRFYDAWLARVTPDGVIFNFDDTARSIRLKSWGYSPNIKSRKIG